MSGRSIALANTVGRAQTLFEELRAKLDNGSDIRLILLHSRFFRNDRQSKEGLLKSLFGKEPHDSAILVATQVIEAGIDISCEHLRTEMCPMNAWFSALVVVRVFPAKQGLCMCTNCRQSRMASLRDASRGRSVNRYHANLLRASGQ